MTNQETHDQFYGLVNKEGFHVLPMPEPLTLAELQHLVGTEGEEALIEIVSNQFASSNTILIVDEEGLLKDLPIIAVISSSLQICGQFLILGLDPKREMITSLPKRNILAAMLTIHLYV